jgi:cyanophycinase
MVLLKLASLLIVSALASPVTANGGEAASIVGTWNSIDRHVSIGSLFQREHGVRKRESVVTFRLEDGRLTGFVDVADHKAISFQERWKDGRTDFRKVQFANNTLTFEFDVAEWRMEAGPLAVENRQQQNGGSIRVVAQLQGQHLVGKWGMYLKDGAEVFRGEWEATRAAADAPIAESSGTIMLIGGTHQDLSGQHRDLLFELAGGTRAKIVVIPTAVATPETKTPEDFLAPNPRPVSMHILHTRDPKKADDPEFVKPLTEATGVFFTNGHLHRLTDVYPGTLVEKELRKLLARGGVIAGTGSGATVLGGLVINRPSADQPTGPGLGLLPKFAVMDDVGDRARLGLSEGLATATNRDHIGLTIDPGAAVVIQGNQLRVTGDGKVNVYLAAGGGKEARVDTLRSGAVLDLAELRREASSRAVQADASAAIVGTWRSTDRHVALGSLFQPVHGVRKRKCALQFLKDGQRLIGYAEGVADRKDGRCDFRNIMCDGERLSFEFDIDYSKEHEPLAVESGRLENKGVIRMEGRLQNDRVTGTWHMVMIDGTEVFRGEWEADREAVE